MPEEKLYLETAENLHAEEYLEALWIIEDEGEEPVKISSVSEKLGVTPPSAVGMLKKLASLGHVEYLPRKGVILSDEGRKIGRHIVRNGMLIEMFMDEQLKIPPDDRLACGMEHHMTEEFAEALCGMLGHPEKCPHNNLIPPGSCCGR